MPRNKPEVTEFILTQCENGGWIVTAPSDDQLSRPQRVAAFSDKQDLLSGLDGLLPESEGK